jgi:flagellar motor switch/type III secretory pathway protein FliN
MNELDSFEPDAGEDYFADNQDTPETVPFSARDLREISSIPPAIVFIGAKHWQRQQAYQIELPEKKTFVRRQGLQTTLPAGEYFFLEVQDEHGGNLTVAVRPDLVWELSGYWFNVELVEWSIENDDEILNILYYALSTVSDYFGWSVRGLLANKSLENQYIDDGLYLLKRNTHTQIAAYAESPVLDQCEFRIRQYSTEYRKNCLWLGRKISFRLDAYMESVKSVFELNEIIGLEIGDLIPLKQIWLQQGVVQIAARAVCQSMQGKVWARKIFLRIDNEDARMEFEDDDWEQENNSGHQPANLSVNNADGFKMGDRGPDAVELDILVGSTTISFNELCNIQEGSLIEISRSLLPIVKMNVAGETVLEGELVRLDQQLMVQVTKKVS